MYKKYKSSSIILILMIVSFILNFILLCDIAFIDKKYNDELKEKDKEIEELKNKDCGSTNTVVNPLLESGQVINDKKRKDLEAISFEKFESYINNKDRVVVMLGYEDCIWCQRQEPILEMFMYDNNLTNVKYLDISKITSENRAYINNLHSSLARYGTPTFILIENGHVSKVSSGAKSTTKLSEMFKDMGIIGD